MTLMSQQHHVRLCIHANGWWLDSLRFYGNYSLTYIMGSIFNPYESCPIIFDGHFTLGFIIIAKSIVLHYKINTIIPKNFLISVSKFCSALLGVTDVWLNWFFVIKKKYNKILMITKHLLIYGHAPEIITQPEKRLFWLPETMERQRGQELRVMEGEPLGNVTCMVQVAAWDLFTTTIMITSWFEIKPSMQTVQTESSSASGTTVGIMYSKSSISNIFPSF